MGKRIAGTFRTAWSYRKVKCDTRYLWVDLEVWLNERTEGNFVFNGETVGFELDTDAVIFKLGYKL